MNTAQVSARLPEKVKPTTIESVKFRDGMLVTADDLDAGMRYPQSLLQTVLRAYFGCGVVCGLGLKVKNLGTSKQASWVVCVDRGVAIDCHGYPIELCAPVELDLSPEACDCGPVPDAVYIVVRRAMSDEAPADACSCDVDAPRYDCRRTRDLVLVKALTSAELEALPDVCRRKPPDPDTGDRQEARATSAVAATSSEPSWSDAMCGVLTGCSDCGCGECWVLLGSVALDEKQGITKAPDMGDRQWVKPTEALCVTVVDRIQQLEGQLHPSDSDTTVADRVSALEAKVASVEALYSKLQEQAEQLTRSAAPASDQGSEENPQPPPEENA
jgi:hypothetical protein